MKIRTTKQPLRDLDGFSDNPAIGKAVQERLAKLRARQLRESKGLVRRARELRRRLLKEARS